MTEREQLLSELAELADSRVMDLLLSLREETIQRWTDSQDDRAAVLAQGEKRMLDRLIAEIGGASKEIKRMKDRMSAPLLPQKHMSKAF